jgi:hypothetical protein
MRAMLDALRPYLGGVPARRDEAWLVALLRQIEGVVEVGVPFGCLDSVSLFRGVGC